MHLLYVDESGHADEVTQKYFIMVGVSFFEKQTYWVANELDAIAARFNPADPFSIELHGSPMKQGKGIWKGISGHARAEAFKDSDLYNIIEPRFDQDAGIVHGLHIRTL